jgi:NhaP-type Na+/H+ and K+/H+ antiporter
MAFGLALGRSKKALAIFCCIGFIAGNFLAFPISWDNYKLGFAIEGAIGGASLGLALKNIRKVIGLAIAGALGLPLGWLIADYIPGDSTVLYLVWSSLPGIIIGALLGATLAYLEKE